MGKRREERGQTKKEEGDDSERSNVAHCGPQHAALCVCVPMALLAHEECTNSPHTGHCMCAFSLENFLWCIQSKLSNDD